MSTRSQSAYLRLITIAALLLFTALFACRPAWSPDGKRVLFASRVSDEQLAISLYDRSTGATELLFRPPGKVLATPLWTPDGKQAVIVCGSTKAKHFTIVVQSLAPRAVPRVFEVATDGEPADGLVEPPVLLGRSLFVAGHDIQRIDLDTGIATQVQAAVGDEQFLVVRAGTGLAYAKGHKGTRGEWEIGRFDADTQTATPLLHSSPDLPWEIVPAPAFSPDGTRIAVAAHAAAKDGTAERAAILVFANGKLETTLPIADDARLGNVAWAPDSARLFATFCRDTDDDHRVWGLLETMVGGSVTRETPLVTQATGPRDKTPVALLFQAALSPDGKTAAMSTAMIEHLDATQHGLYLVDLAGARKVTRVAFPVPAPRPVVTLIGSDTMLAVGNAWAEAYGREQQGIEVQVLGGGSGLGLGSLPDGGNGMLAMSTRPAKPAEIARAQQHGAVLTGHRVAFTAFAVCVHESNPMPSITIEQLAAVFGGRDATRRWADLGVTMPAGTEEIRAVGPGDVTFAAVRELVLGGGQFGDRVVTMVNTERLAFVRKTPAALAIVQPDPVDAGVKVLAVADKAGAAAVQPSAANIADGSYPLARPMFLFGLGEPSPAAADFLRWLTSDAGRQATTRAGFVAAHAPHAGK